MSAAFAAGAYALIPGIIILTIVIGLAWAVAKACDAERRWNRKGDTLWHRHDRDGSE